MKKLLWVDLETTGTDPHEDFLLEIGAVVTNDTIRLEQSMGLPPFSATIHTEPEDWLDIAEVVWDMHVANGLMAESLAAQPNYSETLVMFSEWALAQFQGTSRIPLAGSGVSHFDQEWLRMRLLDEADPHCTELAERFTYWTYDIGSVRRFGRLAGIRDLSDFGYNGDNAGPRKAHRALDDIEDHIQEARAWLAVFELADVAMHDDHSCDDYWSN